MRVHAVPFPPDIGDLTSVTQLFQALGDPTRVLLLLALQQGEQAVSDLVTQLAQPQSTVSRHLGVLRHAQLVQTRRDGTRVLYRLADSHLGDLLIQAFSHAEHRRLGLADHHLTDRLSGGVH
ncbi:DNA-binding transcriptional ArsR family regulator [Deinococcus metalli]|nr:metalloregulator ArsR/SmtB family transcription factor [Deinococcus metalli]MBB5378511.1 DNA-binding transcriptional ArsR family regulator [Deinococcus metalli]